MHGTAPRPPTKRLLVAACLSTGTTVGMVAMTVTGHVVFRGIPSDRLAIYGVAVLLGTCLAGFLTTRYLIQRHRRDAWWDGYATSEEPSAEVIQLSEVRGYEGSKRKFVNGSPG